MKDGKFTIGRFVPILFSLGLACNANAVKVHINSGNPAYPFPQFMEYACGGNLGTKLADGLTHAEIEQQIRDAYQLHANEFEYTGEEWKGIKYIWTPYKAAYDCTEGDGYALLAAAYMADKTIGCVRTTNDAIEQRKVNGMSASIADDVEKAVSKPIFIKTMEPTSVNPISNAENALVDVYNANGQLVKKQVSSSKALDGLAKGVYVVGGQKRVVTE